MSNDLVPVSEQDADYQGQVETLLNGVDGNVRDALVIQIRRLVEKNPEAFATAMRRWLHDGRNYED